MSASCDKNQNLAESSTGKLVKDLRVSELKTELEKRGIDSQGVKVVLTVRLNKALRQEGFDPEKYVFYAAAMSKSNDQEDVSTVETSEGVKSNEPMCSPDHQPPTDVVQTANTASEVIEGPQDVKLVNESDDLGVVADEPVKIMEFENQKTIKEEEPDVEIILEQPKVLKVEPVEPVVEQVKEPVKEPVESKEQHEEDIEGEDEFEEVEEVVPKPVTPGNDEIFLDDEDLLEDPLDEQPLEKRSESATSTIIASADTSRAGTPAATSSGANTDGFLFADDAKKTSIWIRGMEPATKASSVKQFVCQYGKVVQAKIFNSKPINGEIKNCFAFVTFADSAGLEAAMANLHRKEYQGRVLRCERVADSQLTESAERIAKEKKDLEDQEKKKKEEEEEQKKAQERKKRAQIQAPEDSDPNPKKRNVKKPERQTIQAPEKEDKKSSRAVIQAPERDEKARKDRKPIVYKMSPGAPARLATDDDDRGRSSERDSRRTIAAPSSHRAISPIRSSSSRREHHQSLIISARVDTSRCRGGPAKRSVERHVPNSITTSQLRRNPIHVPPTRCESPPRASYETQHYTSSRDVRSARSVRDTRDIRGDRHASGDRGGHVSYHRDPLPQPRHSSSSTAPPPSRGDPRHQEHRRGRGDDLRNQEPTPREREMLEMLRRKEEEHRLREEKLEMQKEREKMKFEAEKLERAKLELELTKQKLALQAALLSERGESRATSSGRSPSRSSSRRRQADHFSPPPSSRPPKVHTDDRRRSGGSSRTTSSSIPSARHVAVAYGIQSSANSTSIGGSSSRGASTNIYGSTNNSTTKDYPYRSSGQTATASSSFETSTTIGGYQGYSSGGYGTSAFPGYQQQTVWSGYDSTAHVAPATNWTGTSSASASSSAASGNNQWPQQQQYSSSSGATSSARHHHRDNYNSYSSGRNNY